MYVNIYIYVYVYTYTFHTYRYIYIYMRFKRHRACIRLSHGCEISAGVKLGIPDFAGYTGFGVLLKALSFGSGLLDDIPTLHRYMAAPNSCTPRSHEPRITQKA